MSIISFTLSILRSKMRPLAFCLFLRKDYNLLSLKSKNSDELTGSSICFFSHSLLQLTGHSVHECSKYFHFLKCLEKKFHAWRSIEEEKCLLKCTWESRSKKKNGNEEIGGKDEQKQIQKPCKWLGKKKPEKHFKDKFIFNCIITRCSIWWGTERVNSGIK